MPNLWFIFTTGLLAGGLSCAAVQGGLLAATVAAQKNDDPRRANIVPIISFLLAKLAAYTILGAILGWVGGVATVSLKLQAWLLTLVSLVMIGTALAMLEAHPIFRYFIIQPPRILRRLVRQQTKRTSIFAPAILGVCTIFIPCGTTQAMMALSISSRSPLSGAAILFAFVLGTFPIFFLLGYSVEKLKDFLLSRFAPIAATIIIGMAAVNLNTAAVLSGSPFVPGHIIRSVYCTLTFCPESGLAANTPKREVTIRIGPQGYTLEDPVIPAGEQVTLTLINDGARNCAQAFTIPTLDIYEIVPFGQTRTVSFTAPTNTNELVFTCSMGMYGGKFTVL